MKSFAILSTSFMLSACVTTGGRVDTLNIYNKSPIQIGAEVFKADKLPAPTVLVMHGCGGVDAHHLQWANQLQQWGFNAVVIDSFTTRSVSSACTKVMNVPPLQRAIDAHLAAKWVMSQEWSEKKVGVLGFSHGAWATLYASTQQDAEREIGASYLTSAVAFYPYCETSLNFLSRKLPLQIHIGQDDDWTPATMCKDLARNWNLVKTILSMSVLTTDSTGSKPIKASRVQTVVLCACGPSAQILKPIGHQEDTCVNFLTRHCADRRSCAQRQPEVNGSRIPAKA